MTDTNRKTIIEHKYIDAIHLIKGTVRETIVALQAIGAQGWVGMDYDVMDADVTFTMTRLETDEEYDDRIKAQARWAQKEVEHRYQAYLKLKEEFGND